MRLPGRRRLLRLSLVDMGYEDGNDRPGNFILNSEDIVQLAVVAFCPMMSAGNGIDELSADANAITSATDTAFEDIAHTEFAADAPGGLSLVEPDRPEDAEHVGVRDVGNRQVADLWVDVALDRRTQLLPMFAVRQRLLPVRVVGVEGLAEGDGFGAVLLQLPDQVAAIAGCASNIGRLLTCLVDGSPSPAGPSGAALACQLRRRAPRPGADRRVVVRAWRQLGEVADPQPLLSPGPLSMSLSTCEQG